MELPTDKELTKIVKAHLDSDLEEQLKTIEAESGPDAAQQHRQTIEKDRQDLISAFLEKRKGGDLSTDQLLNVIFMLTRGRAPVGDERTKLIDALLKRLTSAED